MLIRPHHLLTRLLAGMPFLVLVACDDEQSADAPTSARVPAGAEERGTIDADGQTIASAASPQPSVEPVPFEDVTETSGLNFAHECGAEGRFTYPEPIGPGAALFDADLDGDLDAYLVQGGPVPGVDEPRPSDRLFINDGRGRFRDATESAGMIEEGYGMGAAACDYDNDGDTDLFVTNVGPNFLWNNRGDGTFVDVAAMAGVDDAGYSLTATFFDADRDGDLDLYVTNYVKWAPGSDPTCYATGGARDYCAPKTYPGAADRLYLNRGDGTFDDVSEASGIASVARRGMGVVAGDFDRDGRADLYVANDDEPNLLWMSQGDGTFIDEAGWRGCAVNGNGQAEASMGLACVDLNDDGLFELYATHLRGETHTLWRNEDGFFADAGRRFGISHWSRPDTGFGFGFLDFDYDGCVDLFVANGAVQLEARPPRPDLPYAQRNRLLRGGADGRFEDVTAAAGPALEPIEMSRGVAFGDLDGDGWIDLLVMNNRGPARVLRNTAGGGSRWIGVTLEGVADNRDAIGAVVTLDDGARSHHRLAAPHQGYLSTSERTIRFGLGGRNEPVAIVVQWPNGRRERFSPLDPDRVHQLRQGAGRRETTSAEEMDQ